MADDAALMHKLANLQRLFWLRWITIAGQLLAIAVSALFLNMALPLLPLLVTIGLLACVNTMTGWRLWRAHAALPESDVELVFQLLIDVCALSVLLYFTGGSTNPFVSLYLLPIAIAAAVIRPAYVWFIVGVTSLCYSFLLVWYVPLPHAHGLHDHSGRFSLHIIGMWVTFILAAILIAWFVVRMAASLRERDRQLAAAREDQLRNEQIIGLGVLAAGAAHELGSPLSTIAVLARELTLAAADNSELQGDAQLIRHEVERCKQILGRLSEVAGHARAEGGGQQPLDQALDAIAEHWRLQHPQTVLAMTVSLTEPVPIVVLDRAFEQSLHNIMNNAADVSPDRIELNAQSDATTVTIIILDRGPGFQAEVLNRAGELFFSTKGDAGFGMGVFLANATIERMGGRVQLSNRDGGGACVSIMLPLDKIGFHEVS
ncbi:MAG TPA: ATP-binding protein [Pseudomonadales bacterium]